MIALLNLAIGVEDRFDQVIRLRAGTDGGEVRPHLAARAADGVAYCAGQGLSAVNLLTRKRITFLHRSSRQSLELFGVHLLVQQGNVLRTRECLHETFLIAPTFACGAQTGIGHGLGQLRPSHAGSQHAPGAPGIEQTPP